MMRHSACALFLLCVIWACGPSEPSSAGSTDPPKTPALKNDPANDTIELRGSLMIDFPGDLVQKYKEIVPIGNVRLGLTVIGDLGLDKGNPGGVLHTATVPMDNGIVDPVVVRGELDKMVAKYHALKGPGDVEFKPLVASLVPTFAGTPYEKNEHFCYTIDEIRKLRGDLGVVGEQLTESEISCVRFVWRNGQLLAIYNYVIIPKEDEHLPKNLNVGIDGTDVQLFKETAPVYCAVAEFDVQ